MRSTAVAFFDQLRGGCVVEREVLFQDVAKLLALARQHIAVDGRGVDQKRGGGEPVIVVGKLTRIFPPSTKSEMKVLKASNMPKFRCAILLQRVLYRGISR